MSIEEQLALILEELRAINEKLDRAPDLVYSVSLHGSEDTIEKLVRSINSASTFTK